MNTRNSLFAATAALVLAAAPALGQDNVRLASNDPKPKATPAAEADSAAAEKKAEAEKRLALLVPPSEIANMRPNDQRGINIFEDPKDDVPFEGFKLSLGAGFAQQFQDLRHSNTAVPVLKTDATGAEYDANQLIDIGWGVNLPTANLQLNAQLAPGVRVALESYLSSRHHQESWVKGGYLLIDQSPIDWAPLNEIMKVASVKVGMYPVNYGDAHFRRSDNGNVLHNAFVGNLILDAWTYEPGAEVILRKNGFLAVGGITTGNNSGTVTNPGSRGPSYLGKVGFDRQVTPELRVRLTGSAYAAHNTNRSTLYAGDRAGSRYYMVVENTVATTSANATSGLIDPGFSGRTTALMLNPFVKLGGLELFGVIEQGKGRLASETANRTFNQYDADVVYRFLQGEKLYVGARYNTVNGRLAGMTNDVNVDRTALSAGWFVTPTILLKGEYVNQKYNDFLPTDIRNGAKFHGFVMEGAVSF